MDFSAATSKLCHENHGITPGRYDVLCEKGSRATFHIGNKDFKRLRDLLRGLYKGTPNNKIKWLIRDFLIQRVHNNGGRFLARNKGDETWHELTEDEVKTKVSQKLREEVVDGSVRAVKRAYNRAQKEFKALLNKNGVSSSRLRQARSTMHERKEAFEESKKTWNQNSKTTSEMMVGILLEGQTKDYVYRVLSSFVDVQGNFESDRSPNVSSCSDSDALEIEWEEDIDKILGESLPAGLLANISHASEGTSQEFIQDGSIDTTDFCFFSNEELSKDDF